MAATPSSTSIERAALRMNNLLRGDSPPSPREVPVEAAEEPPGGPRISRFGRSSSAASAGLSVSALKAEISTDTAIVTANCWYSRPVMPGMNAVGMNTAARMRAIATTGPETSSIALQGGVARRHALLDVMLDSFDDDDRVVDHQADRQNESEERQRVDREAEEREQHECSDQRHRHGQQRDQGGPEALEEEEHDEDHQRDRLEERLDDLFDAFGDGQRRVERDP